MRRLLVSLLLLPLIVGAQQTTPADVLTLSLRLRSIDNDIALIVRKSSAATPKEKARLEQLRKERDAVQKQVDEAKKGLTP